MYHSTKIALSRLSGLLALTDGLNRDTKIDTGLVHREIKH